MKDVMRDELGAPKIVDRSIFEARTGRTEASREGSHKKR
jgi:hypothetical protein